MSFTAFGPVWNAAMRLLPVRMDSREAWATVHTIGMQESRMEHRRQIGGPAHGFFQFELGGVRGVLRHKASQPLIEAVLDSLGYDHFSDTSYEAIVNNDILAVAYARCLLYTLPDSLPGKVEPDKAWGQYVSAWRPGKPHRSSWDAFYLEAWIAAEKLYA